MLGEEEGEYGRVQRTELWMGEGEGGEGRGTRDEEGEGGTGKECEVVGKMGGRKRK